MVFIELPLYGKYSVDLICNSKMSNLDQTVDTLQLQLPLQNMEHSFTENSKRVLNEAYEQVVVDFEGAPHFKFYSAVQQTAYQWATINLPPTPSITLTRPIAPPVQNKSIKEAERKLYQENSRILEGAFEMSEAISRQKSKEKHDERMKQPKKMKNLQYFKAYEYCQSRAQASQGNAISSEKCIEEVSISIQSNTQVKSNGILSRRACPAKKIKQMISNSRTSMMKSQQKIPSQENHVLSQLKEIEMRIQTILNQITFFNNLAAKDPKFAPNPKNLKGWEKFIGPLFNQLERLRNEENQLRSQIQDQ